ncbi:MAG: hypothetical protein QOF60_2669 [Actinomycetota bacterium]|jgi:hypothetical protein|nr:hypothetical protein [Actinomycetota bacterium]
MQGTDKHGSRLDDDLKKDTRGGDEAREMLRSEDHRLDVHEPPGFPDELDAERRSQLAASVEPRAFPARPDELLATAEEQHADEWIIEALRSLEDRVYDNVQEVWTALGGPVEEKRA